MIRSPRRIVALPLLAALVLFLGACGGKGKDNNGPDLPEDIANDIAAGFGALAASDSGGWYATVEAAFNGTPRLAPALARAGGAGFLSHDTTFTRGSMNWNLAYTYFDAADAPHDVFDATTVRVRAQCSGTGRIPLAGGAGFTQNYVHLDTLNLDNLVEANLVFGGFSNVDSAYFEVGTTPRRYFMDNLVEYTFSMNKTLVSAFPDSGDAEIDGFVDVLLSPERTDRDNRYDVVMTVEFDGTQTPVATLRLNVESPVSVYRYRINLKTGAVTRI